MASWRRARARLAPRLTLQPALGAARWWARRSELQRRESESLVAQDELVLVRGRADTTLLDVLARPSTDPKRVLGTVELHENGIRYRSSKGNKIGAWPLAMGTPAQNRTLGGGRGRGGAALQAGPCRRRCSAIPWTHANRISLRSTGRGRGDADVLFTNIKHLIFQPCKTKEIVTILHLHLRNEIIVNNKKTKVRPVHARRIAHALVRRVSAPPPGQQLRRCGARGAQRVRRGKRIADRMCNSSVRSSMTLPKRHVRAV